MLLAMLAVWLQGHQCQSATLEPFDFSSCASTTFTFSVLSQMSRQLLDGLYFILFFHKYPWSPEDNDFPLMFPLVLAGFKLILIQWYISKSTIELLIQLVISSCIQWQVIPDFSSSANTRMICGFEWDVLTTTGWIARNYCAWFV